MNQIDANIFYSENRYINYCRKISNNNDLHQDLHQETVLIILSLDQSKIESVYSLFKTIAWKQWNLTESKFYKKYRRNRYDSELIDNYQEEENEPILNLYQKYVLNLIDEIPKDDVDLFVKTIVRLRTNGMTLRGISEELQIPVGTIRITINKFIEDVRSNINISSHINSN